MSTAPPRPHPYPCGTPPVRHAAFLDVGDDQRFPPLSAGCCGVGETGCELNFQGPCLRRGQERTLLAPGPMSSWPGGGGLKTNQLTSMCIGFPSMKWVCTPSWRCSEIKQVGQRGDLQLMVMPSSTPRLLGNFTWKVPLLGMTDSVNQQPWVTQDSRRAQRSASSTRCGLLLGWEGGSLRE